MPEPDLKLNALRHSKQSSRLVLEEHSSCEVPAGCGGVVLRWRSAALVPFHMWLYAPGQEGPTLRIDGERPDSSRALLKAGPHVLTLDLKTPSAVDALFMFAGLSESPDTHLNQTPARTPAGVQVLSAPDGLWKYATDTPPDDTWRRPGFDDSAWLALTAANFGPPSDREKYSFKKLQDRQAIGLGVPPVRPAAPRPVVGFWSSLLRRQRQDTSPATPASGTVFVRRLFEIPEVK